MIFTDTIRYILLSTFSTLWINTYHERVDISGLHYIALAIGELLGSQLGGPLMDYIFGRLKAHNGGEVRPEFHVPLMIPSAVIASAGLFIYGWTAQARAHWAVVDLGVCITAFGLQVWEHHYQMGMRTLADR